MKIASSNVEMASSHTASQKHEVKESMRMWTGSQRPNQTEGGTSSSAQNSTNVQFSQQALDTLSLESKSVGTTNEEVEKDPKLNLLRSMIEIITGRKVKLVDTQELGSNTSGASSAGTTPSTTATASTTQPTGFGMEYDYHESYAESESTSFSAQGSVRTEDGQELSFQMNLSMSRSYYEESNLSIRIGNAATTDPLVLNFGGTATQLTDMRFAFDLNSDGSQDSINFVTPGSGFLVFDRNSDGKINNGREMFGASTGDGFAELAALDGDKNGWIDENDAAFDKLQVWSKDAQGNDQLQSLKEANVGAIGLQNVATPFDVKTAENELQGKIRATGVFLQETGGTGTIQKIDLTT